MLRLTPPVVHRRWMADAEITKRPLVPLLPAQACRLDLRPGVGPSDPEALVATMMLVALTLPSVFLVPVTPTKSPTASALDVVDPLGERKVVLDE